MHPSLRHDSRVHHDQGGNHECIRLVGGMLKHEGTYIPTVTPDNMPTSVDEVPTSGCTYGLEEFRGERGKCCSPPE